MRQRTFLILSLLLAEFISSTILESGLCRGSLSTLRRASTTTRASPRDYIEGLVKDVLPDGVEQTLLMVARPTSSPRNGKNDLALARPLFLLTGLFHDPSLRFFKKAAAEGKVKADLACAELHFSTGTT